MNRLIAFDADDTLWDCQSYFDEVERRYTAILAPYGDKEQVAESFFATEKGNMASMGFGSKAFTLSLVENALRMSGGSLSTAMIAEIISLGKSLMEMPATPLPGVAQTLSILREKKGEETVMVVFTKGEIIEQENKLRRSGLSPYFDDMHIVADKTEDSYRRLCRLYGAKPEETVMIGNSFKSDIAPALNIGAKAIYIPFHLTWKMEHTEEFDHPNLIKVEKIADILGYFK